MKRPRIRFYGEDISNVEIGAWIGIARKRIAHLREYVVPEGTPVFTQRLAFEEARIDLILREDGLDDITIRMLPREQITAFRHPFRWLEATDGGQALYWTGQTSFALFMVSVGLSTNKFGLSRAIAYYKNYAWYGGENLTFGLGPSTLRKWNGFSWEGYTIDTEEFEPDIVYDLLVASDNLYALIETEQNLKVRVAVYNDSNDTWSWNAGSVDIPSLGNNDTSEVFPFLFNNNGTVELIFEDPNEDISATFTAATYLDGEGPIYVAARDLDFPDFDEDTNEPGPPAAFTFVNNKNLLTEIDSTKYVFDYEETPGDPNTRLLIRTYKYAQTPNTAGYSAIYPTHISAWTPGNRSEAVYIAGEEVTNNAPNGPLETSTKLFKVTTTSIEDEVIFQTDIPRLTPVGVNRIVISSLNAVRDFLILNNTWAYAPENDKYIASIDTSSGSSTFTLSISDISGTSSVVFNSFGHSPITIAFTLCRLAHESTDNRFLKNTLVVRGTNTSFLTGGFAAQQYHIFAVSQNASYSFTPSLTVTGGASSVTNFTPLNNDADGFIPIFAV